jgi:putative ABC transport system substrate-binding protein
MIADFRFGEAAECKPDLDKRKSMMMKIGILVLVVLSLHSFALAAQPLAKLPRVGLLRIDSPPSKTVDEFRQGLRELGYLEGQNLVLEIRWAESKIERLPELAAELIRLNVDVIVTHGSLGVRAAKAATNTIPIVMGRIDDADVHGFVATLARPGGNVTGLSFQTGDLSGKWLELLKEALPKVLNLAVLWDATGTANQLKAIDLAGRFPWREASSS